MSSPFPESVELNFELEPRDVRRMAARQMFGTKAGIVRLLVGLIVIVAGCTYVGSAILQAGPGREDLYALSALFGCFIFAAAFVGGLERGVKIARDTKALGRWRVRIAPEGVETEVAGVGRAERPWTAIERIEITSSAIYLAVNKYQRIYIPARIFDDPDDFVKTARLAELHRERAETGVSADLMERS